MLEKVEAHSGVTEAIADREPAAEIPSEAEGSLRSNYA